MNSVGWLLKRAWLDGGVRQEQPPRRRLLAVRNIADPFDEFARLVSKLRTLSYRLEPALSKRTQAAFTAAIARWQTWEDEAKGTEHGIAAQLFDNSREQENFRSDNEFPFAEFSESFQVPVEQDLLVAYSLGMNVDRLLRPRAVLGMFSFYVVAFIEVSEWRRDSLVVGNVQGFAARLGPGDEVLAEIEEAFEESESQGPAAFLDIDRMIRSRLRGQAIELEHDRITGPLGLWYERRAKVLGRDGRQSTISLDRSVKRRELLLLLFKATEEDAWADRFRMEALRDGIAQNSAGLKSAICEFNRKLTEVLGVRIGEDRRFIET
ncbi:MAG: hypothetical protein IT428_03785 [Planctomycetaceae bacterium]|nr:hypothetical protein [Planctomycetaceae bacterium]